MHAAEQAANAEAIKVECERARRRHPRPGVGNRGARHPDQGGHHVHEGVQEPSRGCQAGHGGGLHPAQGEAGDGQGSQGWSPKKIANYWIPIIKLWGDSQFLDKLRSYDKDSIPNKIIKQIKPYVSEARVQPEGQEVSAARAAFCCWVRAMEAYDSTVKVVEPKKKKLAQAQEEYEGLMVGLQRGARKAEGGRG